jgi:two-component system chemotaxis response regulator CheY
MNIRKVLIVEDSPTMRQLIIFALKRLKRVNFVEAGDGVEALKKLSNSKFDIALIDLNMPIMDGLKLISLMKKDEKHKNIPIVVITTAGRDEDKKKAFDLGVNAYITKPIQTAEVLSIVSNFLGE